MKEQYNLQFESGDIIQKIQELRKTYKPTQSMIQLVEPFNSISSSVNTFFGIKSEELYQSEPLSEGFKLQNPVQRAYVRNLALSMFEEGYKKAILSKC